jgi:hypothetical protein
MRTEPAQQNVGYLRWKDMKQAERDAGGITTLPHKKVISLGPDPQFPVVMFCQFFFQRSIKVSLYNEIR